MVVSAPAAPNLANHRRFLGRNHGLCHAGRELACTRVGLVGFWNGSEQAGRDFTIATRAPKVNAVLPP
ncbi:hypothetical protein M5D96_010788 [Drosophila gunungcola]|uniref:Uncharacterized protein n=1 Tax=Drosophila gunungcola TaxID=103775 RepID=A0A9Q0BL40_9MUSC|nr:hypothetical protein M5D96_010788 [Drosophila gunungcola]